MTTVLYTDSTRILSVIGLTAEDIPETFFDQSDIERALRVDLYTWIPTHATQFIAQWNNATEQARFQSDCLVLYCTYFCAVKVLEGVLGIMVKETDGQNEYNRFSSLDFKQLAKDLEEKASRYQQLLLSTLQTPATQISQLTVITPTYDPVTG